MKRIIIPLLVISIFLSFVACTNSTASIIEAYQNGDFETVISSLDGKQITDENLAFMLSASKAHIAYEKGDYESTATILSDLPEDKIEEDLSSMLVESKARLAFEKEDYASVVELLSDIGEDREELQQMLSHSREQLILSSAQQAFENQEYEKAAALLESVTNGTESQMYAESLNQLAQAAFDNYDVLALSNLVKEHPKSADLIFTLVTDACSSFDYDSFLFMDKLISEIPDGKLKDDLNNYSMANGKTRSKAFLKGDWLWNYEKDKGIHAIVTIHVFEDDSKCVDFLKQVPAHLVPYKFEENDAYWTDFVFEGDFPISVHNMTRLKRSGTIKGRTASIELDFENMQILIHVPVVKDSNRIWQKIVDSENNG